MRFRVLWIGLSVLLLGVVGPSGLRAEDSEKAVPTLLIRGEVVSLDTNDPSALQLNVRDRYGFETLIFLESATTISQGEQPFDLENLVAGTSVEVEYDFDVNTAKRHAVIVRVTESADGEATSPSAAAVTTPEPVVSIAEAPAIEVDAAEAIANEVIEPIENATATEPIESN